MGYYGVLRGVKLLKRRASENLGAPLKYHASVCPRNAGAVKIRLAPSFRYRVRKAFPANLSLECSFSCTILVRILKKKQYRMHLGLLFLTLGRENEARSYVSPESCLHYCAHTTGRDAGVIHCCCS